MDSQINYPDLSELQEEIDDLETSEDRIQFLIELGQTLPHFPEEYCTEDFRVVGCQSMVWIVPSWDGNAYHFSASSDAPMVRGLVAVLMSAYSAKTPVEIIAFPIEKVLDGMHLKSFLSPLRSNGLHSMIKRIRAYAESQQSSNGFDSESVSQNRSNAEDHGPLLARIDEIRRDFQILNQKNQDGLEIAYLDNAASSQRPQSVIDSISRVFSEYYANVHRSGHEWAVKSTEGVEASREAVRRFINAARTEEVIFTAGATASVNLIANAWGNNQVGPGDEILLTEMEHHSNIVPWQQLCQRKGCQIRWVPIRSDYTLDIEQFERLLSSRTKLVSFTAVSNVLGTINPAKQLVRMAHQVGATVVVDAAQATPHGAINVRDWDADFVVFSGHKMLASTGVGVCYGKRAILESMPEWQGGGSMIKSVTFDGFTLADLPHKFEAGTPPIAEIISMKPAIEYLEAIGHERLMEHERLLADQAMKGLLEIDGVRVFSPSLELKSGVVSFAMDGIHGEEIARVLDGRGVAIRVGHHCAMPLHTRLGVSVTCRASFYLYNTPAEVTRFVEAVAHAVRILT
ncbi:MAG: SufS family cysteine desulfurase [Planctomycetota bacterium]|nr:SufS family cysteine desulfurase [Planctomycetota bacterium]